MVLIDYANYQRNVRRLNHGFSLYRSSVANPNAPRQPAEYMHYHVLAREHPEVFDGVQQVLPLGMYEAPSRLSYDLLGARIPRDHADRPLQNRVRKCTRWFTARDPQWVARRVLGAGGAGIAILFNYSGPGSSALLDGDVVVKIANQSWDSQELRLEARATKRQRFSAHCIQMMEPEDLNLARQAPALDPLPSDDSSHDELTDEERPGPRTRRRPLRPRPRRERSAYHWKLHKQRHKNLYDGRKNMLKTDDEQARISDRRDFILLEYMQNGSLGGLIDRLVKEGGGDLVEIPNRVLWAFWLCLVRACIGMEYPPKRFHPNRPDNVFSIRPGMGRTLKSHGISPVDPTTQDHLNFLAQQGDWIESVPHTQDLRNQANNVVHFDIEPSNVFIGDFELSDEALAQWQTTLDRGEGETIRSLVSTLPRADRLKGEHELVPRLKVADFGTADRIKSYKRNIYYHRRRTWGKRGIYAPEQFCSEWDLIPEDPNGDEAGLDDVAGNYSCKTNIWQIAWVRI
ncbi:hypothetical protein BKA67DRAFT_251365 [Truncatella angustata]|uniref:Protein kinase domain-containing protein n=1 Tax=Truncatella angustata TaxID=152316 RepID=A0A9P8UPC4_9PEZI|nr:uncharacterized protein BKA67DRAFT_251365 [Truncatella angustata]KAH6655892.1 hypothetical protein BKA67DRAFT_251365 [Truncatella angustata]